MFTIAANRDLGVKNGFELVFLYHDESGESIFLDMDVKYEDREESGVLVQTHYLGEPVEVHQQRANEWRTVLKSFYAVKQKHHPEEIKNVDELKRMSGKNGECAKVCEIFARIQEDMLQALIDETESRRNRRAPKFARLSLAQV